MDMNNIESKIQTLATAMITRICMFISACEYAQQLAPRSKLWLQLLVPEYIAVVSACGYEKH